MADGNTKDPRALATTETTAISTVPAGIADMVTTERPKVKDEGELGTESIGRDDIRIPRFGLAQKMSPEIDKTQAEKYIPGLEFMHLYHSKTKTNYGQGPVYFVILKKESPRWMEFKPINEGGGVIDPKVPRGDARTKFTNDERTGERVKPRATMFLDYIVLNLNDFDPKKPMDSVMSISFKSSGIAASQDLNLLIKQRGGDKKICRGVYAMRTTHAKDKKSGGVYAVYEFENAGWLKEGSALEALALDCFEAWKGRELEVDYETEREPGQDDDDFDTETFEAERTTGAASRM